MSKKVIIIGAGGHAKVVADAVRKSGDLVVGFLDDNINKVGEHFCGAKILGIISEYEKYIDDSLFIIAIGNNSSRKQLSQDKRCRWYTAVHPTAIIGEGASIGKGAFIGPCAVINADASIGDHAIVNTSAIVEHDCKVGDYAHLSSGATMCGGSVAGELAYIRAGAVLTRGSRIDDGDALDAGAVATKKL